MDKINICKSVVKRIKHTIDSSPKEGERMRIYGLCWAIETTVRLYMYDYKALHYQEILWSHVLTQEIIQDMAKLYYKKYNKRFNHGMYNGFRVGRNSRELSKYFKGIDMTIDNWFNPRLEMLDSMIEYYESKIAEMAQSYYENGCTLKNKCNEKESRKADK
jgi:hypothetical protein